MSVFFDNWDEDFIGQYIASRDNGGQEYRALFIGRWDRSKLHVSDAGYCARKAMLRTHDFPYTPHTGLKLRRFHIGHVMHNIVYNTFQYHTLHTKERLFEKIETPVNYRLKELDMEEVSGSCDIVFRPSYFRHESTQNELSALDIKSMHPNVLGNMRDKLPMHENCLQVSIYHGLLELTGIPLLVYMDNGGGDNESQLCWIGDWNNYYDEGMEKLEDLVHYQREIQNLSDFPPLLPQQLKTVGKKDPYVEIGPHWNCNPKYCEFIGVSCNPDVKKSKLFYYDKNRKAKISPTGKKRAVEARLWSKAMDMISLIDSGIHFEQD